MHSFDLVSGVPGVVACNMAAVPLKDDSVDVAVFCLALMGTDYGAFLQVRILTERPSLMVRILRLCSCSWDMDKMSGNASFYACNVCGVEIANIRSEMIFYLFMHPENTDALAIVCRGHVLCMLPVACI